jgi:glycerophosphoryl diester phosphodiesterase
MVAWLAACADLGGPSRVEGLRGGIGYWPENSRTALVGAIAADLDGVQLDVVLTKDHVPVMVREPFFDPSRCTWADGRLLDDRLLVRRFRLDDTRAIVCGGRPDPETPNAVVVAESVLSLDEAIGLIHGGPYLAVHLAIRQESPETGPPDVFAAAVLDRWFAADLPNELAISSPDPHVLDAFDGYARSLGFDLVTVRSWPPPGADPAVDLLQNEADRIVGGLDYVALAEDVGADGLAIDARTADTGLLRAARRAGVPVWLWLDLGSGEAIGRWGRAPAEVLVTAYPGDVP